MPNVLEELRALERVDAVNTAQELRERLIGSRPRPQGGRCPGPQKYTEISPTEAFRHGDHAGMVRLSHQQPIMGQTRLSTP